MWWTPIVVIASKGGAVRPDGWLLVVAMFAIAGAMVAGIELRWTRKPVVPFVALIACGVISILCLFKYFGIAL